MEVIVRFKSNKKHLKANAREKTYIIERTKKIVCYRREDNKPILKQVRMDALKSVTITGYKEHQETPEQENDKTK